MAQSNVNFYMKAALVSSVSSLALGAGFFMVQVNDVYAGPDSCVVVGNVATCTGDQSDGIEETVDFPVPQVNTLDINNLSTGVSPVSGDGVNFNLGSTDDLTINIDTSGTTGIKTVGSTSRGIVASQDGASGSIIVNSLGDITTDGSASAAIKLDGNGTVGDVTLNSVGDLSTNDASSEGIDISSFGTGQITVNSTGDITTSETNSDGIKVDHDGVGGVYVSSTGDISTDDSNSEAIYVTQDGGNGNITINSEGDITTTTFGSEGIYAVQSGGSGDVNVTSTGNINTHGAAIYAIQEDVGNGDVTVINKGNVTSVSSNAILAVSSNGNGNVSVTSLGDLVTDDSDAGINVEQYGGDGNINVTQTGNITASSGGKGIYAYQGTEAGDLNIEVVSGSFVTSSNGLDLEKEGTGNMNVIFSGTIKSNTSGITAVHSGAGDINIDLTGNITSTENSSEGIEIEHGGVSGDINLDISGIISTTGASAEGVTAEYTSGTGDINVNVSGTISTQNIESVSLNNGGSGASYLTNMGSISGTTGVIITGRSASQSSAIISNSGTIEGTAGTAIDFQDDGADVLNISAGSNIIGSIDFGNGNDGSSGTNNNDIDILNVDLGVNAVLNFADTGGTGQGDSDLQSAPEIINGTGVLINSGTTFVAIDPTASVAQNTIMSDITGNIHNVTEKFAAKERFGLDSGSDEPEGFAYQDGEEFTGEKYFWVAGIGGISSNAATSNQLAHDHSYYGAMSGVGFGSKDINGEFGFFGGYVDSQVTIASNSNFLSTDSTVAGVYWKKETDDYRLNLTFFGGGTSNNSIRNVGVDAVKGQYSGYFLSPSVTVSTPVDWFTQPAIFSTRGSYTYVHFNGYAEAGPASASPLTYDARSFSFLNLRSQLSLPKEINHDNGDRSRVDLRFGLDGQLNTGSENVNGSVSGTNFSYSAAGDDRLSSFVGVDFARASQNGTKEFLAGAELQLDHHGSVQTSGYVKLKINF